MQNPASHCSIGLCIPNIRAQRIKEMKCLPQDYTASKQHSKTLLFAEGIQVGRSHIHGAVIYCHSTDNCILVWSGYSNERCCVPVSLTFWSSDLKEVSEVDIEFTELSEIPGPEGSNLHPVCTHKNGQAFHMKGGNAGLLLGFASQGSCHQLLIHIPASTPLLDLQEKA